MSTVSRVLVAGFAATIAVGAVLALVLAPASAQPAGPQRGTSAPPPARSGVLSDATVRSKINSWTIGLAGGELEGAPIRFASDIGRVTDDGDNLHVLPIVTRGPTENIEDLLYLRGIDAAIINTDALAEYQKMVPDIRQRITYILNLFPSELHIFVRPEINSLSDLAGKKVNFNTPGTTAAYSGPLVFDRLKLAVDKTFIPHPTALQDMRNGTEGIAAVVFITSKPVAAFAQHWPPGFKFLPVDFKDFVDAGFYLPSRLTAGDYPELIAAGQEVRTIAIPTILAAYNWPAGSDHYQRLARMTDRLFDRLNVLHQGGFQPKWKDVNAAAQVPGLQRFAAAQEWLDRTRQAAGASDTATDTPSDEERLYQEFLEWRKHRQH